MIFVTVGTERFPFDRLVRAVDDIAGRLREEPVFVQLGESRYLPQRCPWSRYLPYPEISRRIEEARIVVTHGGAGSVLLCLQHRKVPVVLPRRRLFGEHVNDHQVGFTGRMAELGHILLAREMEELEPLILRDAPAGRPALPEMKGPRLVDALEGYLADLQGKGLR